MKKNAEVDVVHFADMSDEERIRRLEHKAAETRKILLGTLLLAKEMWEEELSRSEEGIDIMKEIEKAGESFLEAPQLERFSRFERTVHVIEQRAKTIFDLMTYISKQMKT